jgi:hypothetical protein
MFDYDLFRSLIEADLVAYMEPIVTNPLVIVPAMVLERMASEMDTYDEYHLVYALELGPDHAPDLFARVVPHWLSHQSQAVQCAASRALNRLPDQLITKDLVDAARIALSSRPETEKGTWGSFLERLDKRIGTARDNIVEQVQE